MNFQHLRYMITIADCHSINKASKELHLKQQYLSAVTKMVEQQCGTTIFDRTNRGVQLTEDGAYLLDRFRQIISLYDEIVLGYNYPSYKENRDISTTISLYIPPGLSSRHIQLMTQNFYEIFPNVTVNIYELPKQEVLRFVQHEQEALGIIMTHDFDALQAKITDNIVAVPLCQYEVTAITSPDNTFADEKELSLNELFRKSLIFYAPLGIENSPFYHILQAYGQVDKNSIVSNSLLFLEMLKNNFYSLGRNNMPEDLPIKTIPLKEEPYIATTLLVNREHLNASSTLRAFANLLLTSNHQSPLDYA